MCWLLGVRVRVKARIELCLECVCVGAHGSKVQHCRCESSHFGLHTRTV